MIPKNTRPDDTITVKGKTHTMSYGVLNDITRLGVDIDQLGLLMVDPAVRDAVLSVTLTPRNSEGDYDTPDGLPLGMNAVDLNIDEVIDILEWVVDHLAYFFMRSIEQAARLRDKYAERASSLMSSSTGSEISPSKTPSAGLSDVAPASFADSTGV